MLAIDYGEKHIGLAISDSKGLVASPLEVLHITKNRDVVVLINEIDDVCKEYRVKSLLVGMPQEFTKSHKKTTSKISRFMDKIKEKIDLPLLTTDESFSTSKAQNVLLSTDQNTRATRHKIDKVAAAVFLQEFLNSIKSRSS